MSRPLSRFLRRVGLYVVLPLVCLPAWVSSQTLQFVGCYRDGDPLREGAINLWDRAPAQTLWNCAKFCRDGTVPPGVSGKPIGRPPYTYMLMQNVWCKCGNQINSGAVPIDASGCRQQIEHLNAANRASPEAEKQFVQPSTEGIMVFTVTAGVPPVAVPNRPPNAPTVSPGGWEPPFPLRYEGATILRWQNNGDPDGEPLSFLLVLYQFDAAQRRWVPVPSLRDPFGNAGGVWTDQTAYTFTTQNGLQPNAYYAWIVGACNRPGTPGGTCSFSNWSYFRTIW